MGQASSAQREPSMEEILASIRRIIEDGDTPAPERSAAAAVPKSDTAAQGNEERTRADIAEVESFRAELDAGMPAEADDDDQPAPARLADIQAAVEAQAAEGEPTAVALEPAGGEAERPSGESASRAVARQEEKAAGSISHFVSHVEAKEGEKAVGSQEKHDADRRQAEAQGEAAPAILSEVTGRRVAAAFDELNEAFEASRRQSLHEVAEEMLRPMLQEWLDNNLPTLVERLVREEIERVARGGTG